MKKLLIFFLLIGCFESTKAQLWGGGVDDEDYNFGFTFQYVSSELKIIKNPNWRNPFTVLGIPLTDSLMSISSVPSAGFGIGFVYNYRISDHIDLRLTPSLLFNDKLVNYTYQNPKIIDNILNVVEQKKIESTIAEFPLGIKLKSDRRGNFRAYILAGGKYSIDIATKKRTDDDDKTDLQKYLKMKRNFLSYEAAIGFDLYFENFKLSPEMKLSYSTNSVMKKENNAFSNPIDKMMLRHFTFSLFIE